MRVRKVQYFEISGVENQEGGISVQDVNLLIQNVEYGILNEYKLKAQQPKVAGLL